jgi:methylated-DNA-[protein]-cysteine S-methyltransferase
MIRRNGATRSRASGAPPPPAANGNSASRRPPAAVLRGAVKPRAYYAHVQTAMGPMLVAGEGRRLVAVKFGVTANKIVQAVGELHHELHERYTLVPSETKVRALAKQLQDYLAGKRTAFDVELDLSHVTPFRRDVLLECARIPRGTVRTYSDLARRVKRPNAYRAVGHTMATNPIPIVIPCHRVVGVNNDLTGFGGGLDMKRKLLALEGAAFEI